MEATMAVLADGANTTGDGKLNLLGVFQDILTMAVPHQQPQMYLVMVLRLSPGERGTTQHTRIVLVDADGASVGGPPEFNLTIPSDQPNPVTTLNIILAISNLNFPKFGAYIFDIVMNGHSIRQVPLTVRASAPGQMPLFLPPAGGA